MPFRIYIAAPNSHKKDAMEIGDKLQYIGCSITSQWHNPDYIPTSRITEASGDLACIANCQILLLLDWGHAAKQYSGYYMEKVGYALAKDKQVIWWHEQKPLLASSYPLYSFLDKVRNIYNWEDLYETLEVAGFEAELDGEVQS